MRSTKAKSSVAKGTVSTGPSRFDAECPWLDLGEHGENLALANFPSFLILRLATSIQRNLMQRYTARFGINLPQWRLLALLENSLPMQFSRLASLSTMDKALVSRALRQLIAKDLAVTRSDPRHGKRLLVSITPEGKALHDRILPIARERQATLLAALDDDERAALYGALRKLTAAMDAGLPGGDDDAP
jgi:DNA-binding MarR family transcriptional regulator